MFLLMVLFFSTRSFAQETSFLPCIEEQTIDSLNCEEEYLFVYTLDVKFCKTYDEETGYWTIRLEDVGSWPCRIKILHLKLDEGSVPGPLFEDMLISGHVFNIMLGKQFGEKKKKVPKAKPKF